MIRVFDNGGDTLDQYGIIIGQSVYTMSDQPNHPQGFNQYAGELSQLIDPEQWATSKEIDPLDLPKAVLLAIIGRLQCE